MGFTVWIVEEVSSETGKMVFKESFTSYEDAQEIYNERKHHDEENFVTLYKTVVVK